MCNWWNKQTRRDIDKKKPCILWELLENRKCEACRFNPETQNILAGGSCANRDDEHNCWMELKRYDPKKCKLCKFEDDPAHYECVSCQDAINFEAKPGLKKILLKRIKFHEKQIDDLKAKVEQL
jgi:hypothetical protein